MINYRGKHRGGHTIFYGNPKYAGKHSRKDWVTMIQAQLERGYE